MAFTQIAVSGSGYKLPDGTPADGRITFTLPYALRNSDGTSETTCPTQVVANIVAGSVTVVGGLAATDDPGTVPVGVMYEVVEEVFGSATTRTYNLPVPYNGGPINLHTAEIVEGDPTLITVPVPGPQGEQGEAGDPGPAGADGRTVLSGAGAPGSGLGVDGDFYIDTTADAIYGPKTAGAWGSATSLIGPAGATGAGSVDSVNGDTGPDIVLGTPQVRYVSATGSDSADGLTAQTPMATVNAAVTSLGAGAAGVVYLLNDGIHEVSATINLRPRVQIIGLGGMSNPTGGGNNGVIVKAMPGFVGDYVFDWPDGAVGASWHWASLENISIDCNKAAGVDVGGVHIFEWGEEAVIRRVHVFGPAKSGFLFTGTHAVGHMEDFSCWYAEDYAIKVVNDVSGAAGGSGSLRLIGPSGDGNEPGYYYHDGSCSTTVVGVKQEDQPVNTQAMWTIAGAGTGGGRARLAIFGGRSDPLANGGVSGGTFVRIAGTARPSVSIIGVHAPNFGTIIDDQVTGRQVLPAGSNAAGMIQWGYDGDDSVIFGSTRVDLGTLAVTDSGLLLDDVASAPGTPSSGGALYVDGGDLLYKGTDGVARNLQGASVGVRVYASGTGQTIPSGNLDPIDVNTTEYNDDTGLYTVNLATNSITVTETSLYLATWGIRYSGGTAPGERYATLVVNGSPRREAGSTVNNTGAVTMAGCDQVKLTAGDVVRLDGYSDGGTAVTVASGAVYHTGLALARL